MARRVTPKDGAAAIAMLDTERATRKRSTAKAVKGTKADKVRAYLLTNPDARPVDVAKATGVEASYVWDVRQAMRRKGTLPMPEQKVEEAAS
jgi:hypothetical protein